MNNLFVKLTSVTVILLLASAVAGQNLSAYAAYSNPPSFGGGKVNNYADGLVINGKTFDISKFSQKLATPQILPIGKESTITLKIFDNAGPTTVKLVTLNFNMKGNSMVFGDIYAQYPMTNHFVAVRDNHKLLGTVTAEYKIVQPFVYVTFHITPIAKMDTSNLIVSAMDNKKSNTNALIIDTIKFS